jgi:hypothetical protein
MDAMPDRLPRPVFFLGTVVRIDQEIDGLLPGRSLFVKQLEVDEFAIRVAYEVRPPIVERPTPIDSIWLLCGTDDLGNEYTSAGGAFGVAPDGTYTEGVHSLQPTPHEKASYIELGFIVAADPEETPRRVVKVPLRGDVPSD